MYIFLYRIKYLVNISNIWVIIVLDKVKRGDYMRRDTIFFIVFTLVIFIVYGLSFTDGKLKADKKKEILLDNLVGMTIEEVRDYAKDVNVELEIEYQYSFEFLKDIVIYQDREVGSIVSNGDVVRIVVSNGEVPASVYQEHKVNELGKVPIMMYHGIVDIPSNDTKYTGGNVDKDGYNRTAEAFRNDLEFYYENGYRMIRLSDYVDGIVDVELGKSPIILTFDDGNKNNFNVLGEENGELVIDPNCAVGILEEFKEKYPDYGVTATFFVNSGLFEQSEYNEKILIWLVNHGYDIGNHTMTHVDFTKIDIDKTKREVGGVYQILDRIIPGKYVNIVALPFGSPYKKSHDNYQSIMSGEYNGQAYNTKAALRVGWEAEVSVFDSSFDASFLKRIRAYDNGGKDFDIEMNFKLLENNRYVSDGDINTIVVLSGNENKVISNERKVIAY